MLTDLLGTTLPRSAAPFFREVIWRGPTHAEAGNPCIYLTFDDGPHPDSTPRLLDFLGKAQAPASFFFLGSMAELFPELVRLTMDAGHTVGIHGWTHRSAWRSSTTQTLTDFARAAALLEDLAGQPVRDVRPPYGRFTPALRRWCREHNRRLVLWDLMPGDFLRKPTGLLIDRIENRIVRKARPGSIVVLHESTRSHEIVIPALSRTLPIMRAKGWAVATL